MLRRIHLVTLKRFTRLLTLVLLIQMFISGEPASGANNSKFAEDKTEARKSRD
jgi:hypothetical protein